jgi:hypothetical protein
MTTTLVPKDMLDATQVVNGPEDGPCDWEQVRWLAAQEKRTAAAATDLHKGLA